MSMNIKLAGEIIFIVMELIWGIGLVLSLPLFCIIMIRLVLEVRNDSPRIASASQRKRYYLGAGYTYPTHPLYYVKLIGRKNRD